MMSAETLKYPPLAEPYAAALRACSQTMLERYAVVAIFACGTIIRGTADPRSDLDIHVLHTDDFRERVQEWFEGVACEIFVNPPWQIEKYFAEEREDRRPMTSHMLATGFVVYDPNGIAEGLQRTARKVLEDPPPLNEKDLVQMRYHAASQLEDALDLAERDPEGALLLLGNAVKELAECRVAAAPGWLPRGKDLLPTLRILDPAAAALVVTATSAGSAPARLEAGRRLCLHVTGAEGFFEWKSARKTLTP